MVGDRGTVLRSVDSGVTWQPVPVSVRKISLACGLFPLNAAGLWARGASSCTRRTAARPGTCKNQVLSVGSRMWPSRTSSMALQSVRVAPSCARKTAAKRGNALTRICASGFTRSCLQTNSAGYAVGARGVILRTDDGGATWKDLESGMSTNLFAVALGGHDDVLVTGEQGRIIHSSDAGATWQIQPTITSGPLYSAAYRGGFNIWVAGRGGAQFFVARIRLPRSAFPLRTCRPGCAATHPSYNHRARNRQTTATFRRPFHRS